MSGITIKKEKYYFIPERADGRTVFGKLKSLDNPDHEINKVLVANFGNSILVPDEQGEVSITFKNKFFNALKLDRYEYPLIKHFKEGTVIDHGLEKYSGRYIHYKPDEGKTSIDLVFETLKLKEHSNKLWELQGGDQGNFEELRKKRNEPKLFSFNSVDEFEEFNMIHAVDVNGDSYIDLDSLERILRNDLGDMKEPLKFFTHSCKMKYTFGIINYGGIFRLVKLKNIDFLFSDRGNSFYQSQTQYKDRRKKHAGRYIYNFIKLINHRINCKDKQAPKQETPGYKKEDFRIFFNNGNMGDFMIVMYKEISLMNETSSIATNTEAIPEIKFTGYIDNLMKEVIFDDYGSHKNVEEFIASKYGLNARLLFSTLYSTWFKFNHIEFDLSMKKANGSKVQNRPLSLFRYDIYDEASNSSYSDVFVSIPEFITNFCQHKETSYFIDEYNKRKIPNFQSIINKSVAIYSISADNSMVENPNATFINAYMSVQSAIELVTFFASQFKKNTHWYRNVNKVFMPFYASNASKKRILELGV